MRPKQHSEFTIHLDFNKESKNPERVFQSMSNLTLAMKHLDSLLATSINENIQSHITLSDIRGGSIFSRFQPLLQNIDDEDLRNLDYKRIIGNFLVLGKHKILRKINEDNKLGSINDVSKIVVLIENLKAELDIHNSLNSKLISHSNLLVVLQEISNSLVCLEPDDTVELISSDLKTPFNKNFILTDENIESLLTNKSDVKRTRLMLKVKKPDYLGKSKWVFKSHFGPMDIKIEDHIWLHKFQTAEEVILPGDSVQALIETTIAYDHQGNELNVNHSLIEVLDIVKGHPETQLELPI